jgi:maltose alpha-D-glucosyltransferase/alpha-amylase
VLGYLRYDERGDDLACVYNLSPVPQPVTLDLASHAGSVPVELTGGVRFPPIGAAPYPLTLPGYGFYWLWVQHRDRWPAAASPTAGTAGAVLAAGRAG